MLSWIPRLAMMLVAVVIIGMLVRYYAEREIESDDLERATYLYRIYYDDILNVVDETGRVYPSILDPTKFTDEALNKVFGTHGTISSCLTVTSACLTKTICHDKETYDLYTPFIHTIGKQGATTEQHLFPITVDSCTGFLNITIVRPNS